ncbi:MAG: hypothetical protein CMF52_05640 [Legionellales bacterium]|nr:hypothetical protein [Legionellales bacterium]
MIKQLLKRQFPYLIKLKRSLEEPTLIYNLSLEKSYSDRAKAHPNSFVRYGAHSFSQADEDGLTNEIIKRLEITKGTFVELGVGTGIQNNTLNLLAQGWSGSWFGGEDLDYIIPKGSRLSFWKTWITRKNVVELVANSIKTGSLSDLDLISLDLDGNDYYFCREILEAGIYPKVFIVEYNAKFIPPIKFTIDYDENNEWKQDDYYGASLQTLNDLFEQHQYSLVCCNAATGVNAFFVRKEFSPLFPEVPENIYDIYVPPHFLHYSGLFFPVSTRTILKLLA